jgi:zinc/manganese transport system permease protein
MIDLGLLAPAFVAGLIVLATHVPLGRRVLARGVVFLDLAIAQIACWSGPIGHGRTSRKR